MTTLGDHDLRRMGELFAGRPDHILALVARWQEQGRTLESRVQGTSMGATLPDGARIKIALRPGSAWVPGDIVAFLLGARITVHRVLRRSGWRRDVLITCGDARVFVDPPCRCAQVLGLVSQVQIDGAWHVPAPAPRRKVLARVVVGSLSCLFATISLAGDRVAAAAVRGSYWILRIRARATTQRTRAPIARVRSG